MKKLFLVTVLCATNFLFAQKNNEVLLTINDEKITVAEFKRIYEKNLDAIDNKEAKNLGKNIELFIKYKLKVQEGYALKFDTLPSYKKEIELYRNQLSAPYLQDSSYINKLVKDAYFRTVNEVKAKHILIRTPNVPTPSDTLKAYTKIIKIRDRIVKGEDFGKVAEEVSEDPSARDDKKTGRKGNQGNLGYFSAFKMVYPFEEAAYNTKVGEVSMPFRTRFGYHILKVDDFRKSKGEVEVAHVLIKDLSKKGEQKINEVYAKLQQDEQIGSLAQRYSDDLGTKSRDGKLRKFGTGVMVKPFEDVAFSLEKEGDYSKPFKTSFGWHIVQLIKKHPVKPFNKLKNELENRVKSGSRVQLSKKAVIEKLKAKYKIVENAKAKAILNRNELAKIPKDSLQETLFTINSKKITQEDFVAFAKNRRNKPNFELYNEFLDNEILNYYKNNLEKTEPEFAYTYQEYKDGLLLFELMQEKIWNKSIKDTLGLKNYFNANLTKYSTKDLNTIKGEVMNDYQNYLENNWITDLRKKAVISINKKTFKKLKKHYNQL
ncbi:MAG: peptidylprolyl isomerase [Flavobacteriaceae bacterium]|nr:peptidylprolyl isomerase [Flavobacteriaceae bacterium]